MRKRPWQRSNNGASRRNFAANSASKFFLGLLACWLLIVPRASAETAAGMPRQELAISFDLAGHRLLGNATITIPPHTPVTLGTAGLRVTSYAKDGAPPTTPPPGQTLYSLPGQTAPQRIVIAYEQHYAAGGDGLLGPEGIALTGGWHPRLDRELLFQLTAQLPPGFSAVSEANQIDVEAGAAGSKVSFDFPLPAREINFIAGPYVVEEESFAAGKKLYSYFFKEDQELAAEYRKKTLAYLRRYSELLGEYPFQRFSVVENRLPTGYAMPTFTLLGQNVARLPFIVDTSLGHEVLHSWFGNAIRVERKSGNWCEGLTTYLADQAFAADKGEGSAFRKGQLSKYQSYIGPDNTETMADFVGGDLGRDAAQQANRAIGYNKSSMFFHMLHQRLGSPAFQAGLRDFYRRMNGREANWSDLRESFESSSGEKLAEFFSQWLQRPDLPSLKVQERQLAERDGQFFLDFTIRQESKNPYQLQVPFTIRLGNGEELHRLVEVSGTETHLRELVPNYARELIIDPEHDLMRRLAPAEMPPSWDLFQGAKKKLAVVNSTAEYELFEPLIQHLEASGCQILAANEVNDSELSAGAVIFLGTGGSVPRALFARPSHPATGFTVDIRKNPLNSASPAILVSAANRGEVEKGLNKLSHYGKYSYLHFESGIAREKRIAPSEMGMRYETDQAPMGVRLPLVEDFSAIMAKVKASRVVYIGESHTRFEDHQLQLRVISELFAADPNLAIGMEMFPNAVQSALDDYVAGRIDEKTFLKNSHYYEVWRFDYHLYQGIINFARRNKIPIIALNLDKELVSKVYKEGGLSGLDPEEKVSLPPDRDLDLPGYRDGIEAIFKQHPATGDTSNRFAGFLQAQALWDENMAATIANHLTANPERRMAIVAGRGHTSKETAIPPRVARRMEVSQSVLLNSDGAALNPAQADYLFFTPAMELPPPLLLGVELIEGKEAGGVRIKGFAHGSVAEAAGIQVNDLILEIAADRIASIEDVKIALFYLEKGEKAKVKIRRAHKMRPDQELEFEVKF